MTKFYKKIDTSNDMKLLDEQAAQLGVQAVGISNQGTLYKWDRKGKNIEKITTLEAMEILQLDQDTLDKIVISRGAYVIEEPKEVIEEQTETANSAAESPDKDESLVLLKSIDSHLEDIKSLLTNEIKNNSIYTDRFYNLEDKINSINETLKVIKSGLILEQRILTGKVIYLFFNKIIFISLKDLCIQRKEQ